MRDVVPFEVNGPTIVGRERQPAALESFHFAGDVIAVGQPHHVGFRSRMKRRGDGQHQRDRNTRCAHGDATRPCADTPMRRPMRRVLIARRDDEQRAPEGQQDIADCAGHAVAKRRNPTAGCLLELRERRCGRPGAGTDAQQNARVHAQRIVADQNRRHVWEQRDDDAGHNQCGPGFPQGVDQRGAGAQTGEREECRQPQRLEEPQRCLRDPAKPWIHRPQIPDGEAAEQHAHRCAQAKLEAAECGRR